MANYASVARYLKLTLPLDVVNKENITGTTANIQPVYGDVVVSSTYCDSTGNGFASKISTALKNIGIRVGDYVEISDETLAMYPGDIIIYQFNKVQVPVIITDTSSGNIEIYPKLNSTIVNDLKKSKILRAKALSTSDILTEIGNKILTDDIIITENVNTDLITINPVKKHTAGLLKIGDISLLIDPVQLSFVTQNGYQYFPTIRTAGNPKIPALQDVKNISIQLIFPNVETINNQLIPLYAMFKRAPFVPIYNKDITEFFRSIIPSSTNYLPVALESINIQTLTGFPNTLQATISVLPFDYSGIGTSFRALSTYNDLAIQQEYLNTVSETEVYDRLNSKLYDKNQTNVDSKHYFDYNVTHTDDFEQSIPFRAFYQSIIADRVNVLDSLGNVVRKGNGEAIPLQPFRPTRPENLLFSYNPKSNVGKSISFTYDYISEENIEYSMRSFNKILSEGRGAGLDATANNTRAGLNKQGIVEDLTNELVTISEVIGQEAYKIRSAFKPLERLSAYYGINISSPESRKIKNWFDLLLLSFFDESVVGQSATLVTNKGPSDQVKYAKMVYNQIKNSELVVDNVKAFDIARGLIIEGGTEDNPKFYSASSYLTNLVDKLITEINALTDEPLKQAWTDLINYVTKHLAVTIFGSDKLALDSDDVNQSIIGLPIQTKTIKIDNKDDVVVGWSLTFANKFTPIKMLDFIYPFYQHLGSNDPELSMTIHSMQYHGTGLKDELSKLHDRLLMNVKLLYMNSPELITYLDPRLTIDIEGDAAGNIFNCFGIKYMVFNGSTISSVPNQPGSWNISLSLSSANLSITDYHSIIPIENNSSITPEIMNLLLRTKINNGNLICYGYEILAKNEGNLSEEVISEFASLFGTTATYEEVDGQKILKKFGSEVSGINRLIVAGPNNTTCNAGETDKKDGIIPPSTDEINRMLVALNGIQSTADLFGDVEVEQLAEIKKRLQPYTNLVHQVEIADDTAKLNTLIKDDPEIGYIIRNIIRRMNAVNRQEFELVRSYIDSVTRNKVKDRLPDVALFLIASGLVAFIPGIGPWVALSLLTAGGVATGTGILDNLFSAFGERAKETLLSSYNSATTSVFNIIKTQLIGGLSSKILRDPLVRNKLIKAGLIKDIDIITNNLIGINCYNDFDVPSSIFENTNKIGINNFSPDFYLYNKGVPKHELLSYISDSYSNMASMRNMMMLSVHKDQYDTAKKVFDSIKAETVSINNQLIQKICANLSPEAPKENYTLADLEKIGGKLKEAYALKCSNNPDTNPSYEMDPDAAKFTVANVALQKRALELSILQTALGSTLTVNAKSKETLDVQRKLLADFNKNANNKNSNVNAVQNLTTDPLEIEGSLQQLSSNSVNEISGRLNSLIEIINGFGSGDDTKLKSSDKYKTLKKEIFSKSVTQPSLLKFEQHAYSLMQQIMLLNEAIIDYKSNGAPNWEQYSAIPEIAMMSWFGIRENESRYQRLKLINMLSENYQDSLVGLNAKLYPTFKILFVEEDRGLVESFDDYYSFNAIQTIDIVANKYTPGKTAVVRLTNVTGTLTNKISMMRDNPITSGNDNIFLGSLDVKPGTKIIIKMGYASSPKTLKTVFIGRIVEMNNGPQVELICQSFGTQLNHDIIKLKFGLLSTDKEHGDIASAILDSIPGLDGLGSTKLLDVTSDRFTGTNVGNYIQSSPIDSFLLSSVIGRVSAITYGQDNQRDENIYLPYKIYSSFKEHPTFDWIVYNQSAWNAIQEVSLYHKNCYPIVKFYNTDYLSKIKDIRETLVVGDKSGYYKYTDSFSLSTMRVKEIREIVDLWNSSYRGLYDAAVPITKTKVTLLSLIGVTDASIAYADFTKGKEKEYLDYVKNLFKNPLLCKILVYKLLNDKKIRVPSNLVDVTSMAIGQALAKVGIVTDTYVYLISKLSSFNMSQFSPTQPANLLESVSAGIDKNLWNKESGIPYGLLDAIFGATIDKETKSVFFSDINMDEVLHVDEHFLDNTLKHFELDPRYKRIQKQHLVTSSSDIISNDLVLSEDFNNVVSVYFLSEPKPVTTIADLSDKDINNLRSYTIKSFGDLKDTNVRLLESFQKNIDTNWLDVIKDGESTFAAYLKKQVKTNDNGINKEFGWDSLPIWHKVGLSLLQREVEKMYRGSIKLIGNPNIDPMDIVHINDSANDMKGPIEVEEVIHSFNPMSGFTTTITPSLITYDRTPQAGSDIAKTKELYDFSTDWWRIARTTGAMISAAGAGLSTWGWVSNLTGAAARSVAAAGAKEGAKVLATRAVASPVGLWALGISAAVLGSLAAYQFTLGHNIKYSQAVYDSLGTVFGRDCINFNALTYHGVPYMTGFGGVDYTNIKTLINHQIASLPTIERIAVARDPEFYWMRDIGKLEMGSLEAMVTAVFGPGLSKVFANTTNTTNWGQ